MSESLPSQIGRFLVQSELGRGGFGRVFKAFDPTVSRLVAVKVLTEGGKEILTRFRNEATVAGNLRHENIVTVYEYGAHEGKPFLAMEFLEGENLHHTISSNRPLSLMQKCQIMSQVAEGLHCAHRNRVVHRDVKPANIMVLADGRVKIMDFGIARVFLDSQATRLTQEGHILGTLLYMAPEQFNSSATDVLCDIFAYGVIFYELVTGRHPFMAADARVLMYKISFDEPPPLQRVNPDLPEALQRIITRLLQKDRELRYQSLREVQLDLGPILADLRQQQALELLGQAQQSYESGLLDQAQALVQEVLDLDSTEKVARALWENLQQQLRLRTLQPRIDGLLKKGHEQMAQRLFEEAMQSFEAARRLDPDSGVIQGQIQQARGHLERARKVAALLIASRRDFERQDYTGAYKSVAEALQHDPQNPDAEAALQKVQNAIEQLAKVDALMALRSYDEALAVLTALGPGPGNLRVSRLLESVRAEKDIYERKNRLQTEMATVTELLRDSRFEGAAEKLQLLKTEFPDDDEVGQLQAYAQRELAAKQRVRWVGSVATDAGTLLDALEFERALEVIDQGLRRYPGDSGLIRLLGSAMTAKADWECREAVQATLDKCAELRAEQRSTEAIEVVETALREYSGEARLLDLLHELEAEAIERVRRKRDELRTATEARWVEQVEAQLSAGDSGKAAALLSLAEVECPGSVPLQDVRRRVDRAQQGRAYVRDLLARAEAECKQGRYADAQVTIHKACTSEHAGTATRKLLLNALARHAQAAVDKDWRVAEALAAEAHALDPNFCLPEKLDAAIAGRKKDEIVCECLAEAERLQNAGDPVNALVQVERGLLAYADEPRLKRLGKSLSDRAREFKETLNRELEQIGQTAQSATDPAALEPLRQRAQAIADGHGDIAIETVQRKARTAVLRKRMLLAGGLAAALVFGVAGLRVLRQQPNLIPLKVTSSPPGAIIQAGQEICTSSGCVFKLKPGTYTIEARRDGYRPVIQQVTLDAAKNDPVTLSLEPLRSQIQISTNFASGSVQLDGKSAGELRDGQLTLRDLAFGKHRLAVTSPDGQGRVAFETSAGRLPALRGKVEADDADAIVVSNLGGHARLDCNFGNGKVTVDGKPAGELSANGLELHDLVVGARTLQVGERVLVVSVQPEPVLNLSLTSNRNIGTLVIDTNVENPTVVIDKKRYPGTASQGLIRIPLKSSEYAVSLQKNGYRNPAPQTVRIQKGGTEKLTIRLEPLNGVFRIHDASPGTQVSLDGKPAGVVSVDERVTIEVATGEHTIELTKHGYAPKRIVRRLEPGQTVEIAGAEAILNPDQNTVEETRRKTEQSAWDAVRKNDRAALQQYLEQHAGGRFAPDASNLISKLDQAEKQRAEQQKRDEEQRKKTAEAAAARQQQVDTQQRANAEKQAILEVLKKYAAAYNNRDAGAVKAVFPEVPKYSTIVSSFRVFRSFELTLDPAEPEITGDSAVIRCHRTIKVADEHGPQPPRSEAVTFRLQKTAGRWVIASLQ